MKRFFLGKAISETTERNRVKNSASGTASQIPLSPQNTGSMIKKSSSNAKERRKVMIPEKYPFP